VLADPDKLHRGQQFSFLRVASKKKMRTDKLFLLHSFITVTWFVVYAWLSSLRSAMPYYSPDKTSGQQGALDRFALRLRRLAKLSLTLDVFADKS